MENNNKKPTVTENTLKALKEAAPKAIAKMELVREVKKLSRKGSPWTIPQEILQEIIAAHTVANPEKKVHYTQLREELIKEIESRYADDEETKNLLVNSIPEIKQFRTWFKKEGWEEAVWGRIRGERLFSAEKRAQVIEAIRQRALDKSDVAAKIWLTLSGDYSEKMEVDNKTIDTFRDINNILHRKKEEE